MNDECSNEYCHAITYVDNQSAIQNMKQVKKGKKQISLYTTETIQH